MAIYPSLGVFKECCTTGGRNRTSCLDPCHLIQTQATHPVPSHLQALGNEQRCTAQNWSPRSWNRNHAWSSSPCWKRVKSLGGHLWGFGKSSVCKPLRIFVCLFDWLFWNPGFKYHFFLCPSCLTWGSVIIFLGGQGGLTCEDLTQIPYVTWLWDIDYGRNIHAFFKWKHPLWKELNFHIVLLCI